MTIAEGLTGKENFQQAAERMYHAWDEALSNDDVEATNCGRCLRWISSRSSRTTRTTSSQPQVIPQRRARIPGAERPPLLQ